jgi:hypothetical protein
MCSRSGAHFCRIAAAAAAAAAAPAAADAAVCQAPRARWLSRLLVFARSEMGLGRACASGSAGRGWTERVLVTRSRARGWLHASVRPERKCVRARVERVRGWLRECVRSDLHLQNTGKSRTVTCTANEVSQRLHRELRRQGAPDR